LKENFFIFKPYIQFFLKLVIYKNWVITLQKMIVLNAKMDLWLYSLKVNGKRFYFLKRFFL